MCLISVGCDDLDFLWSLFEPVVFLVKDVISIFDMNRGDFNFNDIGFERNKYVAFAFLGVVVDV